MDPILKALLLAMGLDPEGITEESALAALKQLQDDKQASDQALAALKATPPTVTVDPAQYVPIAVVTELQTQVAALSAKVQAGGLDQLIDDAKKDGRLLPAMEPWARELGQSNIAALKSFLDAAKPVAALKGMQAGDETPPPEKGAHGLTADELEAATLTGRTPEEYAALKAK